MEESALRSVDTVPCSYCGKYVYEEAEVCPHCGSYISLEDSSPPKPRWFVIGVVISLAAILLIWTVFGV